MADPNQQNPNGQRNALDLRVVSEGGVAGGGIGTVLVGLIGNLPLSEPIVSSLLLFVPFMSVSIGALFIWGRLRIESWFQRSNARRNTVIAEETIKRLLTLDLSPSAKKEVIDQQHRLVTTQAKQAVDRAITPKE